MTERVTVRLEPTLVQALETFGRMRYAADNPVFVKILDVDTGRVYSWTVEAACGAAYNVLHEASRYEMTYKTLITRAKERGVYDALKMAWGGELPQ